MHFQVKKHFEKHPQLHFQTDFCSFKRDSVFVLNKFSVEKK